MPRASIIVPTRERPAYLEVTLASIAPQARDAGAEVIVVDDGDLAANRAAASRHGARYEAHDAPRGPNAARNTGIAVAGAPLVVLVDDDVEAPAGWLGALLDAADAAPGAGVLGGPIRARLEGARLHACGREGPPITHLDLGPRDRDAEFVWSANMAIRRTALDRVGDFDAALEIYGDEEEWQRRHRAAGGRIRYVAAAGLDHRRAGPDARLLALSRAEHRRGRSSRRFDELKGVAPPLRAELRTLAGCVWHIVRRRCGNGICMAAHAAGRVRAALARSTTRPRASAPGVPAAGDDFLAGASGTVTSRRASLRDLELDARLIASGRARRLARDAAASPPRRNVLALAVERTDRRGLLAPALAELERTRHTLETAVTPAGDRGKFENLDALLAEHPVANRDWLLVLDDDVALPRGFLDRFLFLAESFELRLAQPAHRRRSHAAWEVTRRRRGSVVRETRFVEIGPVFALHRDTFGALLPFPPLRMGWGLDAHWAAIAREHGWRQGVVDALPVRHGLAEVGSGYSPAEAAAEARAFLADRPYLPAHETQRTLASHRYWRRPPG